MPSINQCKAIEQFFVWSNPKNTQNATKVFENKDKSTCKFYCWWHLFGRKSYNIYSITIKCNTTGNVERSKQNDPMKKNKSRSLRPPQSHFTMRPLSTILNRNPFLLPYYYFSIFIQNICCFSQITNHIYRTSALTSPGKPSIYLLLVTDGWHILPDVVDNTSGIWAVKYVDGRTSHPHVQLRDCKRNILGEVLQQTKTALKSTFHHYGTDI